MKVKELIKWLLDKDMDADIYVLNVNNDKDYDGEPFTSVYHTYLDEKDIRVSDNEKTIYFGEEINS